MYVHVCHKRQASRAETRKGKVERDAIYVAEMYEMRIEDLLTKIHDPYPIPPFSIAVWCETKRNKVEWNVSLMLKAEMKRTQTTS